MRVLVLHTRRSPCRCHVHLLRAARALGLEVGAWPVEGLLLARDRIRAADLVLDHTDTFLGRASLRPIVRHVIEAWGGRLVGAGAAAAETADDKVALRRRLQRARLAVPRGRVVEAARDLAGVPLPAVVKRPFEHGSRGTRLVRDRRGLRAAGARWLRKGPVLVEELVEGVELAASVIGNGGRARVLPLIEVVLAPGELHTEERKWRAGRAAPLRAARLPAAVERRVRADVARAFAALRLRDYARFDLRLPADGVPRFLDANVRPSFEPRTELRRAGERAGLDAPALLRAILRSAARRHGMRVP